jgi:uncharacterized membrane protein YphA (DoxX/SURF4 family)
MNAVIWIVQVLLAIAFIGAGLVHATQGKKPPRGMEWMSAVPASFLTTIGVLEVAGGIGLIVPEATGILPVLTPLAAAALALVMVFAALFHLRRPGETSNVAFNIVLGLIAVFVALGRFVIVPAF